MEQPEVAKLEKNIHSLRSDLKRITFDEGTEEFLKIIRRPGWTTPAEGLLVNALIDSMRAQVQVLAGMQAALLAGSREVRVEARAVR
jgi:hypothetical protein